MRDGADVIVQGALSDGPWFGKPDLLRRVSAPSGLGEWSYEIADTKLARETRAGAILQLGLYSRMLAAAQGAAPEHFHVVIPPCIRAQRLHPEPRRLRPGQASRGSALPHASLSRHRLRGVLPPRPESIAGDGRQAQRRSQLANYPEPVEHCHICAWAARVPREAARRRSSLARRGHHAHAAARARSARDRDAHASSAACRFRFRSSRVAGLSSRTCACASRPDSSSTRATSTPPLHELRDIVKTEGLCRLARAVAGRCLSRSRGRPPRRRRRARISVRPRQLDANGAAGLSRRTGHSTNASSGRRSKQVMDRHCPRDRRASRHARVSLRAVRDHGVQAADGHGMRRARTSSTRCCAPGGSSTCTRSCDRAARRHRALLDQESRAAVRLHARRAAPDASPGCAHSSMRSRSVRSSSLPPDVRETVEGYNQRRLRLHAAPPRLAGVRACNARSSTVRTFLDRPSRRRKPRRSCESAATRQRHCARAFSTESTECRRRTTPEHGAVAARVSARLPSARGQGRLVEILPAAAPTDDELLDEPEAVAGLELSERVEIVSTRRRKSRPAPSSTVTVSAAGNGDPAQAELKTRDGPSSATSWQSTASLGRSTSGRRRRRRRCIRRPCSRTSTSARMSSRTRSRMSATPWHRAPASKARTRSRGRCCCVSRRALHGDSFQSPDDGARPHFATDVVTRLDRSVLAIQGPPGSGKTYTGARMICALVAQGKSVGVTGPSHKAIVNLLWRGRRGCAEQAVRRFASRRSAATTTTTICRAITAIAKDDEARRGSTLASSTSWAARRGCGRVRNWPAPSTFCSSTKRGRFRSRTRSPSRRRREHGAARRSAAARPAAAGQPPRRRRRRPRSSTCSARTTRSRATAASFCRRRGGLRRRSAHSRRSCSTSRASRSKRGLERQALDGVAGSRAAASGMRTSSHDGRTSASDEEVEVVAQLVARLDRARLVVDRPEPEIRAVHARRRARRIAVQRAGESSLDRLPGARVGTVDKFQGQAAPVVIYSMATSRPEDAPRGMEFLYSLNRLNVATSRARCAVIVVANPRLFEPDCVPRDR